MVTIITKPLSVNQSYQGRKVKTQKYREYEKKMLFFLPKIDLPPPPYSIHYEFGFSSASSDVDNPIKPFQDILQTKYKFDDKEVYEIVARKKLVKKGKDYIRFSIKTFKQ